MLSNWTHPIAGAVLIAAGAFLTCGSSTEDGGGLSSGDDGSAGTEDATAAFRSKTARSSGLLPAIRRTIGERNLTVRQRRRHGQTTFFLRGV